MVGLLIVRIHFDVFFRLIFETSHIEADNRGRLEIVVVSRSLSVLNRGRVTVTWEESRE